MSNVRQMLAFVRTFDMIYMANVVLNSYVIFILCIHKKRDRNLFMDSLPFES